MWIKTEGGKDMIKDVLVYCGVVGGIVFGSWLGLYFGDGTEPDVDGRYRGFTKDELLEGFEEEAGEAEEPVLIIWRAGEGEGCGGSSDISCRYDDVVIFECVLCGYLKVFRKHEVIMNTKCPNCDIVLLEKS